MSHEPVLLKAVLEYLHPRRGQFFIDGTIDGGGHATAILERIMPGGMLLGVDWDERMVVRWKEYAKEGLTAVHGNYAELPEILERMHLPLADGLLIDLGFSSEQLASSGKGFSFGTDAAHEPLLMTYHRESEPVWKILRDIDERDLADIIYRFGGERASRRIAKAIKAQERRAPIMTAGALADLVRGVLPPAYERGRIDRATRTFQALRIFANRELKNIETMLAGMGSVVKSGGRVVIITFHSLEDRIVKHAFQLLARENSIRILTKKPITASREEIRSNPRSRSAKLRAIQLQ